ncbi:MULTISPECIES: Ig-like domain-containing protein [unclassified Marinimicrobium]|jgi:hypothetical protein|uniref:Ig-like domain-containing protein n=1 Tax=unclassified Marinimicrobium TaxID=2632100 RepID=UPI000C4D97E7|nr:MULTISPECIES: Ig-like domain-containing protein [unclassified Marinimicrobium]MAN52625.1 hypothetical protein [Marinimicrobium sp.]|tara:strand:- start:227 stop:2116 length:1890 start_codon:yes stop_codon:yes gene_type:complete
MNKLTFRSAGCSIFAALILSLALAGCGSDDNDSRLDNINNNGNTGGDPNDGGTDDGGEDNGGDGDTEDQTSQLGRGVGSNFVEGEIAVDLPSDSSLSAGGSTILEVTLVNDQGDLINEQVTVSFSSSCISSGGARLQGTDEESETSVTTSTGSASVTYQATGCVGEDEIVASASSETRSGINSARATINVEQDTLDQVQFIGASPSVIGIRGMGAQTTSSEVVFKVVGANGSPMREVPVTFALSSNAPAGANLANDSGTTNSEGQVTARVRAGTGAGVANVIATANGVSTLSRQLVITTTIPTQRHTSLSASDLYPVAWNTDGVESELTIRLGDQNNNHIPEGTAVYFTASAGIVDAECLTGENSACSVTWRSQGQRPMGSGGVTLHEEPPYARCPGTEECRAGRVYVLASTEGNESFIDINSNGLFDVGTDLFAANGNCAPSVPRSYIPPAPIDQACDDLGPSYLDTNFNGTLENDEIVRDPKERNNLYNGILCRAEDHEAGLCSREGITIRESTMLVMTSPWSNPLIPGLPSSVELGLNESVRYDLIIADENGNGMPAGTQIEINEEFAENVTFTLSRDTLGGSSEPSKVSLQLKADDTESVAGSFVLSITYEGAQTNYGPIEITAP